MNPPIIDAALIIGHRYQMGRRTWHLCVVPGCSDSHSTRHQFPNPDKDRKRFDVWLQLVQNPNLLELDPKQVFTNYSVCHQHFTANDKSLNMFLVWTAIPIHNLPPATGIASAQYE